MSKNILLENVAAFYGHKNKFPPLAAGIEVEMEFRNNVDLNAAIEFAQRNSKVWKIHNDGSLIAGMEIVTSPPVNMRSDKHRAVVFGDLRALRGAVEPVRDSPRTSVHVHINMCHQTFLEVFTCLTAFWLFEGIMVRMCGPDRDGNLFCLPITDAQAVIDRITDKLMTGTIATIEKNHFKYSSINIVPLREIGTIEVRLMRGLTEPEDIEKWAELLVDFFEEALKFKNPTDLLNYVVEKPEEAIVRFFGDDIGRVVGASMEDMVTVVNQYVPVVSSFCFYKHDPWNVVKKPSLLKSDWSPEEEIEDAEGPRVEFAINRPVRRRAPAPRAQIQLNEVAAFVDDEPLFEVEADAVRQQPADEMINRIADWENDPNANLMQDPLWARNPRIFDDVVRAIIGPEVLVFDTIRHLREYLDISGPIVRNVVIVIRNIGCVFVLVSALIPGRYRYNVERVSYDNGMTQRIRDRFAEVLRGLGR